MRKVADATGKLLQGVPAEGLSDLQRESLTPLSSEVCSLVVDLSMEQQDGPTDEALLGRAS
jgi:hypothetical protein